MLALTSILKKAKIMASSPITSWQIDGEKKMELADFLWTPKSLQTETLVMKLTDACSLEENL